MNIVLAVADANDFSQKLKMAFGEIASFFIHKHYTTVPRISNEVFVIQEKRR